MENAIVYLGMDSFPRGFAEVRRARLISKALIENGYHVLVLNRWWGDVNDGDRGEIDRQGVFEKIEYIYASGRPYRPESWMLRKYLRIAAIASEFAILLRLKARRKLSAAIVTSHSAWRILYYCLLSRIMFFPILLNKVELEEACQSNPAIRARLNAILIDRTIPRFVDGLLPISDYLCCMVEIFAPRKPYLKVPVLVEMARGESNRRNSSEKYFLFCGALSYFEVIEFILAAFEKTNMNAGPKLYLVVNGHERLHARLRGLVATLKREDRVRIFSGLTDQQLAQMYSDAFALLAPLRPTLQDIARFPHKIGEYCAAGRPIITTNYGEIKTLFTNNENAIVVASYDTRLYARAMEEITDNERLADDIGAKGKDLAQREFSLDVWGRRISQFMDRVIRAKAD